MALLSHLILGAPASEPRAAKQLAPLRIRRSLAAHRRRRLWVCLVAGSLVVGACGDDDGDERADASTTTTAEASTTIQPGEAVPLPTPTTAAPAGPMADVGVKLTKVASFAEPLALAMREGDDGLYVAEKGGVVRVVRNGTVAPEAVLDISGEVTDGSEQGLLGIAFSPDGGRFYASFTNRDGDSRLWEYAVTGGKVDAGTRREVLAHGQPFPNHNGGQVLFGPDGLLYYFAGDGGSGGDPQGNGQKLSTRLGKILRIDPKPSGGAAYTVPSDNPFVGRAGALPEIYSYGLRNPWRNSFDRATGDLWIGDVGQNKTEEVDFSPKGSAAGANYGWSAYEGSERFNPAVSADGHIPPIHEYPTAQGCSVTGGYVYRGTAIPDLAGAYVFGDFCNGKIQGLRQEGGRVTERADLGPTAENLSSFGEDRNGNLYAFSLNGGMFRIDPA